MNPPSGVEFALGAALDGLKRERMPLQARLELFNGALMASLADRLGDRACPALCVVARESSRRIVYDMRERVVVDVGGAVFSPREFDTLSLATRGRTNSEIAAELGITVHAVKFHLASIYRKLGVTNRTEAAVKFIESRREPVAKDI